MTIRRATPADAAGIVRVQSKTWLATYPNKEHGVTVEGLRARLARRSDEEKMSRWEQIVKNPASLTLVAEDGGEVVGFCNVTRRADDNRVGAFYILPEFQHHGAGSKMMKQALAWLDPGKPTRAEVASYNAHAIKFYEQFGFKPGGRIDEDTSKLPPGSVIPEIEMIRPAGEV